MEIIALPFLPSTIDPFSFVLVLLWQSSVQDGHVLFLAHLVQSFFLRVGRPMVPAPQQSLLSCGRCSSSQSSKQSHLERLRSGLLIWACHIASKKALCWWCREKVALLGSYVTNNSAVTERTKKAWTYLWGWCPASILCHLQGAAHIVKIIMSSSCKSPHLRLLWQHVVWGSMRKWTCAVVPSGWEIVGDAQGSSKLFYLSSASHKSSCCCASSLLPGQAIASSSKWRTWKVMAQWEICCDSHFLPAQCQHPVAHSPLVKKQHFGQFGPFFNIDIWFGSANNQKRPSLSRAVPPQYPQLQNILGRFLMKMQACFLQLLKS